MRALPLVSADINVTLISIGYLLVEFEEHKAELYFVLKATYTSPDQRYCDMVTTGGGTPPPPSTVATATATVPVAGIITNSPHKPLQHSPFDLDLDRNNALQALPSIRNHSDRPSGKR